MNLTIHPVTLADIDTVVDFSRMLNEEDPSFTGDFHFEANAVRTALIQFLAEPLLGRAWLVGEGDMPIGYVILTFGFSLESRGRDGIIDEIYIIEKYRGRGIGRRVLDFVETEARQIGLKKLYLEVERPNSRAQKFYSQLGYIDHNRYLMSKLLD